MVGWHHQLDGHEFEQTLGDSKGQGSLVCSSPWQYKGLDTTSVQLSSVAQSCLTLCDPMESQASLSMNNSRSLLKPMSLESVMPSNHLILCCPLLLPPSIFPSIRVFSSELVFHIRWPKYWSFSFSISSVQFSSVAQSCPTLGDPMNHSTPGLPAHHHLPEFTQTHIHRVRDSIQPSHPLSSPSSPAPNPSQHQSLFQ